MNTAQKAPHFTVDRLGLRWSSGSSVWGASIPTAFHDLQQGFRRRVIAEELKTNLVELHHLVAAGLAGQMAMF